MPAQPEAMDLEELRRHRDAIRDEEEAVSYRRRLLHAQLDIVEAAAVATDHEEFQAMLAEVLSDAPPTVATAVRAVEISGPRDAVELEPLPADLLDLTDEERAGLLARLRAQEQVVSDRRRELLAELDHLQEELVRRFQRDGVDARALLGEDH